MIWPPAPSIIAVQEKTYRSTPEDKWRCNLYMLLRNTRVIGFIAAIALLNFITTEMHARASLQKMLVTAAGVVAIMFAVILLGPALAALSRLIEGDNGPECTTRLTETGIYDAAGLRQMFLSWHHVSSVKTVGGDLYIFGDGASGFFIPRTAWNNPLEENTFCEEARRLWQLGAAGRIAPIEDPFPGQPTFRRGRLFVVQYRQD